MRQPCPAPQEAPTYIVTEDVSALYVALPGLVWLVFSHHYQADVGFLLDTQP